MFKKLLVFLLYIFPFFSALSGTIPFVTTWQTDNTGVSTNNQITIPTFPGEVYSYMVDWGDGILSVNETGNATHTYSTPGQYTISITGVFPRIYFNGEGDAPKLLSIDQWGNNNWSSMEGAFYGCVNMQGGFTDAPDLTVVESMAEMFREAESFNSPIDDWNVSNVTDMSGLFQNASVFNQLLNNWLVDNVTNMSNMFNNFIDGATIVITNTPVVGTSFFTSLRQFFLTGAFNQDLSNWNVSRVENMSGMFAAVPFNQDISSWNVVNVKDMSRMFNVTANFNQPLNNWQVDNVADMSYMFGDARMFNQDIGNWNVSSVINMRGMFSYASMFNQAINNWDVTQVTDMGEMFNSGTNFNQDISGWEVGNVELMNRMFQNDEFFNQDISGWDVSKVTNMSAMFLGSNSFSQNIETWNVRNVTNFSGMFAYLENYNQPLNNWVTSSAVNLSGMFGFASSFNQSLSNWDVTMVEEMRLMFYDAVNFNQDLGTWDVTSLTTAADMFEGVQLSTENYDSLLIGWESSIINSGVLFSGGSSQYCAGETARERMQSISNWIITDEGSIAGSINVLATQNLDHNFIFPTITGSRLTGSEAYYLESGGQGIKYEEGDVINFADFTNYPIDIYIYDEISNTCSSEQQFELTITEQQPLCTVLISPFNGEADIELQTSIEWETVFNANGYFVSVGTTPFGNELVNAQDVVDTFYNFREDLDYAQEYYVTVTPYNSIGSAETCISGSFRTKTNIQFPKFFTPNNDGVNDQWNVPNPFDSIESAFVFDRYGKLLNQIVNPDIQGWDGNFAGNPMPSSDYWYLVRYTTGETFKGSFTLKR